MINIVKNTSIKESRFLIIKPSVFTKIKQGKNVIEEDFNQFKDLKKSLNEDLMESYKNQIDNLKLELTRKDNLLNSVISNSSQERERTDTIIMKLTQDLENIRNENQLLLETTKKEKELKQKRNKKKSVVSIEEYINKKVEEDIQRSNFESEKRRLKDKYSDPLQGKSVLYKLYIKMFHPEKLRREA